MLKATKRSRTTDPYPLERPMSKKDDKAMQKAADLMKAHQEVVPKLKEMGHLKAAKNIENRGGRWDSPEVRNAAKKGHER